MGRIEVVHAGTVFLKDMAHQLKQNKHGRPGPVKAVGKVKTVSASRVSGDPSSLLKKVKRFRRRCNYG